MATAWLVALVVVLQSQCNAANRIYIYQRADGTRLITDHVKNDSTLKLVRRFGVHVPTGKGSHSAYTTRFNNVKTIGRGTSRYVARKRDSKFDQLIALKSQQHGVDPALVKAVVQIESSYNPVAVSHKGATGLMQLMPATAARFGVADRKNPDENVDAGVRYLKHLLNLFNGEVRLALAAYNAGENAVLRYRDIPPYPETLDYVDKVMQLQDLYATN